MAKHMCRQCVCVYNGVQDYHSTDCVFIYSNAL